MASQGYLHPQLGFAVHFPEIGSVLEEDATSAVLAVADASVDRPAIVTVALQAIPADWDSERFAAEALSAQGAVLGRLRVIDRQPATVDGLPAARVLLQRTDESGEAVVLEEWRLAQNGRGWIVSAMCPVVSYRPLAPLIRATAESLALPEAVEPLPPRPAFDADSGALTVSADELTALTDLYERREPADEEARNALARLAEAGVVDDGRPIAPVEAILAVVGAATLRLDVQAPGAEARAWWADGDVALLLNLGGERRQLVRLDGSRLPGVLADLVGLGPRRTDPARVAVRTTIAELAEAFAGQGSTEASRIVAERGTHWRVDARFLDAGGFAMLEAFDSPTGWWLVRPEGTEVTLEPVTATELFDHLAEVVAGP